MRLVLFGFATMTVLSCSADPVATGSKRDITNITKPSPSPATTGTGTTSTSNAMAGDATNGASLLKSNCDGCHKVGGGGIARDLTKTYADATMLDKANAISSHNATVLQSIKDNKADYMAALAKR